jgi:membrane protease YdiL (CAAX protease family)
VLVGGPPPASFTLAVLAANVLAAVAEAAWFRRYCYGVFEHAGPVFAVGASAVLFALVHVAIYGWWVVPLDLAAGVVLGWQRAATGSWTVPAITHACANVLVLW